MGGHEEIVKLLLNAFGKKNKEKLIDFVIKQNNYKETSLHFASRKGNLNIVKSLLNAFEDKKNLIDFLMKENENKNTVLHLASLQEQKEIVKYLLNAFGEEDKDQMIEFLMKED